MIRLNIHEAKTHLSQYLDRLAGGETILLCKRDVPIAEIHALPPERGAPRPIGLDGGAFKLPPSFFEPLPEQEAWSKKREAGSANQDPPRSRKQEAGIKTPEAGECRLPVALKSRPTLLED
jgi:antitoxin (DNA-binding transcriptional repressor) of toxin-antitoxin stability system